MMAGLLEAHSYYSAMSGTASPKDLIAAAKKSGYSNIVIADTGGFFGVMQTRAALTQLRFSGANAVRLTYPEQDFNALVLPLSFKGYQALCSLISKAGLGNWSSFWRHYRRGHKDWRVVTNNENNLGAGAALVYWELELYTPGLYQQKTRARELGLKCVAHAPVYYLEAKDADRSRQLQAIAAKERLTASTTETGNRFLRSPVEIETEYAIYIEEIQRAYHLTEVAGAWQWPEHRFIFPKVGNDANQALKELCEQNLPKRYPTESTNPDDLAKAENRLGYELDIIRRTGYADYFLVMARIVGRFQYTCGRGSAAASIVSYLLFITHVDPVAHDLYFERFLHIERKDPPDIDVDFPWDERTEVADYVFATYGSKAAMVANHITLNVRSSVRELAKLQGFGDKEITPVTKNFDFYYDRSMDTINPVNTGADTAQAKWRQIFKDAAAVQGSFRHLGLHCGGVVITPRPVHYYIPVQTTAKGYPAIQLDKDQCEDYGLVKIDLLGNRSLAVVRDVLASLKKNHRSPLTYETMRPLQDPLTIRAMSLGDTIGVFYAESPAMRQLQKKTRKGDFEHLVLHSSIIRPAANNYITEYVHRLRGKPYETLFPEMREMLAESYGLMSYQEDISRVVVRVADMSVADGDRLRKVISNRKRSREKRKLKAKLFRNLMQKGHGLKKIRKLWAMIESFSGYSFCKPHSASYALLTFKACYLKVHYPAEFMGAVISNQGGFYSTSAYINEARRQNIQVMRPDINNSLWACVGRDDQLQLGFMLILGLSEAYAEHIIAVRNAAGPFLTLADFLHRVKSQAGQIRALVLSGGFISVAGYHLDQQLREAERFFAQEKKVAAGQMELMGLSSQNSQPQLTSPNPVPGLEHQNKPRSRNGRLLVNSRSSVAVATSGPRVPGKTAVKESSVGTGPSEFDLRSEEEAFGYLLSDFPMSYFRPRLKFRPQHTSRDFQPRPTGRDLPAGGELELVAMLVTHKTVLTKHEDVMRFVSFEDEYGMMEAVLFPQAMRDFGKYLNYSRPLLVKGRVDWEFEVPTLNIYQLTPAPFALGREPWQE